MIRALRDRESRRFVLPWWYATAALIGMVTMFVLTVIALVSGHFLSAGIRAVNCYVCFKLGEHFIAQAERRLDEYRAGRE